MSVPIIINLINQKKIYNINPNDKIVNLKNKLIHDFKLHYDFCLNYININLIDEMSFSHYNITSDSVINLIFTDGFIFLETYQKLERINVVLDDTNNVNEKLSTIKEYLNKIYDNYQLEFNNVILNKNFDNKLLKDIGIKFNINQNVYNTIKLKS